MMHIDESTLTLALTAITIGFLGSTHCLAMCGGIASALNMQQRSSACASISPTANGSKPTGTFSQHALYSFGRLLSYALFGAIAGALGQAALAATSGWILPALRALTGIMLILMGLYLTQWLPILTHLERLGAKGWSQLSKWLQPLLPTDHWLKAISVGFIWGWIPCGLVYSTLVVAMTTQSAAKGALVMLFFGIGTLPAVIGVGMMTRSLSIQRTKMMAGILLILFGLSSLGYQLYHHFGHHHHAGHMQHTESGEGSAGSSHEQHHLHHNH